MLLLLFKVTRIDDATQCKPHTCLSIDPMTAPTGVPNSCKCSQSIGETVSNFIFTFGSWTKRLHVLLGSHRSAEDKLFERDKIRLASARVASIPSGTLSELTHTCHPRICNVQPSSKETSETICPCLQLSCSVIPTHHTQQCSRLLLAHSY